MSAINYGADIVSGSGIPKSQVEMTIQRIDGLKEEINRETNRYLDLIEEIHNAVNAMTDNREKLILRMRYIEFKTWGEIQNELKLERSQMFAYHQIALNHFTVPENDMKNRTYSE